MPAYSGKFTYRGDGGVQTQGPCQLSFDTQTCVITPASGAPLAFDLGDVERVATGDWDLQLTIYPGKLLQLDQFGKAFGRMSAELLGAWRDRSVRCLLLEDLEEVARFDATGALGDTIPLHSEIRLYGSNIAVLPMTGTPLQWRLADVDSVSFDDQSYSVILSSGAERLVIAKLAKKTEEFIAKLDESLAALRARSGDMLHKLFPFLGVEPLQRLLTVMPEGRSVRLSALAAVDPNLPEALLGRAVDARLRPYFAALRSRSVAGALMTGFKFTRKEEEEGEGELSGAGAFACQVAASEPEIGDQEEQPAFFWFFFPLAERAGSPAAYSNTVAWEASTGAGRATYFFRVVPPERAKALADSKTSAQVVEQAVADLTRGLALVNFRREPVYLPDTSLELQPRFHRYAIGARKLPGLRSLRAAFIGRAAHSTLEAWNAQFPSFLGDAATAG